MVDVNKPIFLTARYIVHVLLCVISHVSVLFIAPTDYNIPHFFYFFFLFIFFIPFLSHISLCLSFSSLLFHSYVYFYVMSPVSELFITSTSNNISSFFYSFLFLPLIPYISLSLLSLPLFFPFPFLIFFHSFHIFLPFFLSFQLTFSFPSFLTYFISFL